MILYSQSNLRNEYQYIVRLVFKLKNLGCPLGIFVMSDSLLIVNLTYNETFTSWQLPLKRKKIN